jgi:RimJ/RimL family protein N-acetyltransferase
MADRLRQHDVTLRDGDLVLRPMTEGDWDALLRWNQDPEVLYYSEGARVDAWSLEDVQGIYRDVSEHAYVFIAELAGRRIGECWLQEMNLDRILSRLPRELDLRRIDLMIGEKDLWGRGLGTRMIALLVRLAFEQCGADAVFGCEVADHNPRSRRAFERNGFVLDQVVPQGPGSKAREAYDMVLRRKPQGS